MTQQLYQNTPRIIGFRSIQLLKTQTLGIGSYGSVCKALCDDLLCAAKIIHPTLFDPNGRQRVERQREHRLPISRFMQECEFMSAIRHPNIIQYLGTHEDPQTRLPVLLMELMDDSLSHFLESSQDAVAYHIQVNFCHDITLAISYLHSNGITHRDLSSNNVLLHGNVKAKVTDFGMAKFGDINPRANHASFTMCPGTDVYMPPEAMKDKPVYTAKIDCFAIGTLIIQILTRCFPDPGERLKRVKTTDPRFPTVSVQVPEIERRQNHISQVDPNHPLLPIALDCLKDNDFYRPSSQELYHRVVALKETPQFTESVRKAQESHQPGDTTEREEELKDLRKQVQDKDEENYQMRLEHAQQIQGLQQIIRSQNKSLREKDNITLKNGDIIQERNDIIRQKDYIIGQKNQQIEEKERHLQHVRQELKSNQQVTAQFQTRIQELEQQLKRHSPKQQPRLTDSPHTRHHDNMHTRVASRHSFTLKWREVQKAPCKMYRRSDAIVHGDMVYLRAGDQNICAYNSRDATWNQFPQCETKYFTLAVVDNLLTTIGGRDSSGRVTNRLISLTEETRSKRWREVFQTMPTKRSLSIAVCTRQALIVVGGLDQEKKTLKTVEVMDIEKREWTSAEDLPEPLTTASVTIYHDRIYIVGGMNHIKYTKSVYTCTLIDLFQSCQSRSLRLHLTRSMQAKPTNPPRGSTVWNKIADLPVIGSTCVTHHGRLLAIGGENSSDLPTSDVRIYHPTSNTWEVISKMNISRRSCFAAVLPTNELMVVGGCTNGSVFSDTDSVEIGTI